MTKYLLEIDSKKEWNLFKKNYKKQGYNNLNEAINGLIKKHNKEGKK